MARGGQQGSTSTDAAPGRTNIQPNDAPSRAVLKVGRTSLIAYTGKVEQEATSAHCGFLLYLSKSMWFYKRERGCELGSLFRVLVK